MVQLGKIAVLHLCLFAYGGSNLLAQFFPAEFSFAADNAPAAPKPQTKPLCFQMSDEKDEKNRETQWRNWFGKLSVQHEKLQINAPRAAFLIQSVEALHKICGEERKILADYQAYLKKSESLPSESEVCDPFRKLEADFSHVHELLDHQTNLVARFLDGEKGTGSAHYVGMKETFKTGKEKDAKSVRESTNTAAASTLQEEWKLAWANDAALFVGILRQVEQERAHGRERLNAIDGSMIAARKKFPQCSPSVPLASAAAAGASGASLEKAGADSSISSASDAEKNGGKNPDGSDGQKQGGEKAPGDEHSSGFDHPYLLAGGLLAVGALAGGAYYLKKNDLWDPFWNEVLHGNGNTPAQPSPLQIQRPVLPDSKPGPVYPISGTHSTYGAYHGQLEFRSQADGSSEVLRTVTYDSYQYEGLSVAEAWSGTGKVDGNQISATFTLKQADSFSVVDGSSRSADQFNGPLTVNYSGTVGGTVSMPSQTGVSQEQVGASTGTGNVKPPWKNERLYLPSKGTSSKYLGKLLSSTFFLKITNQYRSDPFTASSRNKPEFQSETQYFVLDPTDSDYLRANSNTIRVENKVTDPISLTEAALKHDAYAPTVDQKAQAIDQDLLTNHVNSLGLYTSATFDASGNKTGLVLNNDGGLWAGMYAGSQAMRWLVTKDPVALDNFKKALGGLMLLMDVTGDPKEFARTADVLASGETLPSNCKQGAGSYSNYKYIPGGNNDMIKGIFHAFAWAYEILPDGDPVLAQVSAHASRLTDLTINNDLTKPRNILHAQGLKALATGDGGMRTKYLTTYSSMIITGDALGLSSGYYYGGIGDWSGINLSIVSLVTEVLIAKNMMNKQATWLMKPVEKSVLRNARQILMDNWSTYATTRFSFVTIAAHTFGAHNEFLQLSDDTAPSSWGNQNLWSQAVSDAKWRLREFPVPRAKGHSISYDFTLKPDWSASAWPTVPWKTFSEDEPTSYFFQGAYDYPIYERGGVGNDNFNTSAFDFKGGGNLPTLDGRFEFIHMYWMSKLGQMIDSGT